MKNDLISRQAAISEEKMQIVINNYFKSECNVDTSIRQAFEKGFRIGVKKGLTAQPERCEYYALCRHGRDENKLRARLKFCEYCNEDSDGYVTPIEKNNHAFVRFGINGWELDLKANG